MAEVSGPTSSMPGYRHELPAGQKCDEHSDREAVARIQGETDSFGAEYYDLCRECLDKLRAEKLAATQRESKCDWCKEMKPGCAAQRDYDEGMCGRVYDVCRDCRDKYRREMEALAEESYDDRDEW